MKIKMSEKILKEIKKDRARINKLIKERIKAIEIITSRRKTHRGKQSIGKVKVLEQFKILKFKINTPEYKGKGQSSNP